MSEEVTEIKQRLDIVEYIQARVPLKRQGRNFAACCPFHREKTPSFIIFPEKQRFHCFGCHMAGDIFTFAMEYEKLEFKEALESLAQQAGVTLSPRKGKFEKRDTSKEEAIGKANDIALEYFLKALHTPAGDTALKYMKDRGFSDEILKKYQIGYSPDEWQGLIDHAKAKGVDEKTLIEAGLAKRNENNRVFDFFRGRVMFPVRSPRGKLVGFGARILGDGQPKYLNTPETPVFNKGKLLYGFDIAQESFRDHGHYYMMEGYTDVMMVEQAKAGPATATLGTAMTEDHVRFLKRFAAPIYLVYDNDEAGKNAAQRSLPFFIKFSVDAKVLQIPDGKDPCEFLSNHQNSREIWEQQRAKAKDLFWFKFECLAEGKNIEDTQVKIQIADQLVKDLSDCPDEFRQQVYLEELGQKLDIPSDILRKKITKTPSQQSPGQPLRQIPRQPPVQKDSYFYILSIILDTHEFLTEFEELAGHLTLPVGINTNVLQKYLNAHSGSTEIATPVFEAQLNDHEKATFRLAMAEDLPSGQDKRKLFMELLGKIQDPKIKEKDIREQIKEAEAGGDFNKVKELMSELNTLLKRNQA